MRASQAIAQGRCWYWQYEDRWVVYDEYGKCVASCTSEESAVAALHLLNGAS